MSDSEDEIKINKYHCNSCQQQTNHWVKATHTDKGEEEHIWWNNEYSIVECCGCGETMFRRATMFSEDWDIEYNPHTREHEQIIPVKETFFPPAVWRSEPRWLYQLQLIDNVLKTLIEETYMAIHSDSMYLSCMGSRALLDRVIEKTVGAQNGFKKGLNLLVENGFISQIEKKVLAVALEAGHASTHRGWKADRHQLRTVMDIVENLIEKIFILPQDAATLKPNIPKRSASAKSNNSLEF